MTLLIKENETILRHRGPVTSVVINEEISRVFTAGYDGAVGEFNFTTGEFKLLGVHNHLVNKVVSNGKTLLATCSSDYSIIIWDVEKQQKKSTLLGHNDDVEDFVFINHNKGISTSRDKRIIIWNLNNGSIERIIYGHDKDILSIAAFEDKFVTTGDDKTLKLWSVKTGDLLKSWGPFDVETDTCAIDIKNKRAVLGCDDGVIRIFCLNSGELLKEIHAHKSAIKKVAVSPVNGNILSAAYDQKIYLWNSKSFDMEVSFENINTKWERSLTFSPSGKYVLAGSFDGTVILWDSLTGRKLKEFGDIDNSGNPCFNQVSVNDNLLATVSDDGYVRLGDISSNDFANKFEPQSGRYLMNAVHFTQNKIFTGSHNQKLHIFNLNQNCNKNCTKTSHSCINHHEVLINEGPINIIKSIGSGEDELIFIGCYSGKIIITDSNGTKRNAIKIHDGAVKSLVLHPNEQFGISCSAGGELISWDFNGKILDNFIGHSAIINDIDIDPTGNYLASVSRDFTLKIFEINTGRISAIFDLGNKSLKSVKFIDEKNLVVGDYWGNLVKVDHISGLSKKKSIAQNGISSIDVSNGHIAASSYDGSIYILDTELNLTNRIKAMEQKFTNDSTWER